MLAQPVKTVVMLSIRPLIRGPRQVARSFTRIAIADDDEAVRDALALLIDTYGFVVRAFASGTDLLQAHEAAQSHCIVTDQQMPGLTGLEVLQALRARGDTTPVILITGKPDTALHAKAEALGAAAVLLKPLSPAELTAVLHKMGAQ
jgi:FixJ family two-component response regulator